MRLFRNRPEYRFVGRIHEQHTGEMPLHLPERFEVTDLHVLHYGYGAERVAAREKGERNRVAARARRGRERRRSVHALQPRHRAPRRRPAGRGGRAALDGVDRRPSPPAGGRRSTCRRSRRGSCRPAPRGRARRRRSRLAEQALALYPDHTDIVREAALSARDTRRARRAPPRSASAASSWATRPRATRARSAPARSSRSACSPRSAPTQRRYDEAAALLERSLAEYPRSRRPAPRSPTSRRCAPATRCSQVALAGDPAELTPRSRRRATPASAPTRSRCTPPGAKRSPAVPRRCPSTRRPPRSPSLDRLLELQEFEAFESLAGLWNTLPLPERDRRELLAGIYMARGFLDSAAEEWLAIAASEPTGPALAGLARVAHARGLADDARVLVDEALRLDPTIAEARALRDALEAAA